MRDLKIRILPDLWNNWHWFVFDADFVCVAQSACSHFHFEAAQNEAKAVMHGFLA